MANKHRTPENKMQEEIYGRVDYHKTPISAFNNERERLLVKNAISGYKQLAEYAEVHISHSMEKSLVRFIKESIV